MSPQLLTNTLLFGLTTIAFGAGTYITLSYLKKPNEIKHTESHLVEKLDNPPLAPEPEETTPIAAKTIAAKTNTANTANTSTKTPEISKANSINSNKAKTIKKDQKSRDSKKLMTELMTEISQINSSEDIPNIAKLLGNGKINNNQLSTLYKLYQENKIKLRQNDAMKLTRLFNEGKTSNWVMYLDDNSKIQFLTTKQKDGNWKIKHVIFPHSIIDTPQRSSIAKQNQSNQPDNLGTTIAKETSQIKSETNTQNLTNTSKTAKINTDETIQSYQSSNNQNTELANKSNTKEIATTAEKNNPNSSDEAMAEITQDELEKDIQDLIENKSDEIENGQTPQPTSPNDNIAANTSQGNKANTDETIQPSQLNDNQETESANNNTGEIASTTEEVTPDSSDQPVTEITQTEQNRNLQDPTETAQADEINSTQTSQLTNSEENTIAESSSQPNQNQTNPQIVVEETTSSQQEESIARINQTTPNIELESNNNGLTETSTAVTSSTETASTLASSTAVTTSSLQNSPTAEIQANELTESLTETSVPDDNPAPTPSNIAQSSEIAPNPVIDNTEAILTIDSLDFIESNSTSDFSQSTIPVNLPTSQSNPSNPYSQP